MDSNINTNQFIILMIIACIIFVVLILFSKPLKSLVRIAIQGIIGAAGMYTLNFILAPLGIFVGVNYLTVFIVAVLGLPGFVTMYLMQSFLL